MLIVLYRNIVSLLQYNLNTWHLLYIPKGSYNMHDY